MKKSLLILSVLSIFALASCSTTSVEENPKDEVTEVEEFKDEVLKTNMEKLLVGFRMNGNVTQSRYEYNEDKNGFYVVEGEPFETNLYYTNVAYNSKTENAFYKYSYREIEGVSIPAEGPYTYFEDENGYAYEETIDYTNVVKKNYNSSMASTQNGLTFGDNGFYNFFKILTEDDFTLDESFTAYTKYDLNIDKAGIIASTLLYSLNSGATALPTKAYIRVDNGTFTQLNIELSPISSTDNTTGEQSLITNSVVFTFSNLGEETIEHITAYEEDQASATISNAFKKFEDTSFKLTINDEYTSYDTATQTKGSGKSTKDFYFTGEEIYFHEVKNGETSSLDKTRDYYLAPLASEGTVTDAYLYPYAYDEESQTFVAHEGGLTFADGTPGYASGFCGHYLYEDYLPIIADVSGTFFEYNEKDNVYTSKDTYSSSLNECFMIKEDPYSDKKQDGIYDYTITLDENGNLSSIRARYSFDSLDAIRFDGAFTLTFSDVGNVTLEGLIS